MCIHFLLVFCNNVSIMHSFQDIITCLPILTTMVNMRAKLDDRPQNLKTGPMTLTMPILKSGLSSAGYDFLG